MNLPKGLAIGLLSVLLLLSLSTLGLAMTVKATALNADFVASQLDKLDMSPLMDEVDEAFIRDIVKEIPIIAEMPEEAKDREIKALVLRTRGALANFEPLMKEEISNATHTIYDYLLGESPSLDLTDTLYDTVLSTDLIASLIEEIDLYFLVEYLLIQEITEQVAEGLSEDLAFLAEYVDDAIFELEPWIREEVDDIIVPITDYILGKSQSLDVVISIAELKESQDLRDALWEAVKESPPDPADLGLPPDFDLTEFLLYQAFDMFYEDLVELIPSTFEINEDLLGPEIPAQITEALAEADEALKNEQIREYIGYPQTVFTIAIIVLLLSLAGIILINRQVRGVSRILGPVFLASGVLELIGILIIKNLLQTQIAAVDMPSSIQVWLEQLVGSSVAPLQTFSIVLIVVGAALLAVSFVYRQNQSTE